MMSPTTVRPWRPRFVTGSVLLMCVIWGLPMLAQEDATDSQDESTATPERAEATPPQRAPLTSAALGNHLEALGYETTVREADGSKFYVVRLRESALVLILNLSADATNLWISAMLEGIDNVQNVDATRLAALLRSNEETNGPFYGLNESDTLTLNQVVPNVNLTATVISGLVNNFARKLVEDAELWGASQW